MSTQLRRHPASFAVAVVVAALGPAVSPINWVHLSSETGQVPDPGGSTQQTAALVARLDNGPADGVVIACRVHGPALVWMRRTAKGWDRYVIEKEFLPIEAGGAAYDIDGDGDLDVVFGEDASGHALYWWENPSPDFNANVSWTRRLIKAAGANQHHDQVFGDFRGTGRPQLVFWNQGAKTLFIADIPPKPKTAGAWPLGIVYAGQAGEQVGGAAQYAEGIDAFDVDGDGRTDLLAGNSWFTYQGGAFAPVRVGTIGGRIRAGRFTNARSAQIVIAPGDGSGPLRFYEARGDPARAASWHGRDLLDREMVHGHTLEVADIDGDGNLDIFAAEMAKWTSEPPAVDHAGATAWILFGDGRGHFHETVLVEGHGWHEGRLGDFDGDGDMDIVNKPYNWDTPRLDFWLNNGIGLPSLPDSEVHAAHPPPESAASVLRVPAHGSRRRRRRSEW